MNPTKIKTGSTVRFFTSPSKFPTFSIDEFYVETDLWKHIKSVASLHTRYYSIKFCLENFVVKGGTDQLISFKTIFPALNSFAVWFTNGYDVITNFCKEKLSTNPYVTFCWCSAEPKTYNKQSLTWSVPFES